MRMEGGGGGGDPIHLLPMPRFAKKCMATCKENLHVDITAHNSYRTVL